MEDKILKQIDTIMMPQQDEELDNTEENEQRQRERQQQLQQYENSIHEKKLQKQILTKNAFGNAYAYDRDFWIAIVYSSALQGLIMGCVALGFFNLYTLIENNTWKDGSYIAALNSIENKDNTENDISILVEPLRVGNGQWWYIGLLAGSGLFIGIFKVIWTYSLGLQHEFVDDLPSFLEEIYHLQSNDIYLCIGMLLTSAVSIGTGASVGPEISLGATGCSLGT